MSKLVTLNFPFCSGIKSKKERRGKKNMRKYITCFGLILCVSVMFAVEAGATVPFADDLPDVRLMRSGLGTPQSMQPAFDLDDYVIDNDTTDGGLSWGVSVEGGGPTVNIDTTSVQLALHEADVLAQAAAGLWDATFTADDTSDIADTVSTLKYADFWLTEPKFTADNRLSFQGSGLPRFTYVKLFDGSDAAENTPALTTYVDEVGGPAVTVNFGPLTMYDLTSGAPVRVDQGQTVTFGGLGAWVNQNTGAVSLTPSGALSCAVLISIPAVLQASSFDRSGNWDGKVIMVAPAAKTNTFPGWTTLGLPVGDLAQYCRFENIPGPPAPLQPGGAGSSTSGTLITGGWRMDSVVGLPLPTVSILTPAQMNALGAGSPGDSANQFAGATSGNALQLAFTPDAAGMAVSINSFKLSPLVPGTIYGFSMNVATDIPAAQIASFAQNVKFVAQGYTRRDNAYFAGSLLGVADPAGQQTVGLPVDGEWQQVYVELRIPDLSFALDNTYVGGSTGTSQTAFDGMLNFFRVFAQPNTTAFNVYVDNIYIYPKGMSDLNYADVNETGSTGLIEKGLANGNTAVWATYNAVNPATNGKFVDNTFESGSTLADNNWLVSGQPGFVNMTPSAAFAVATSGRLNTSGSLQCSIGSGTPTGAGEADGGRAKTRPIAVRGQERDGTPILDDAGNPVPNLAGEGYYGVSFWITSGGASCVNNPQIKVYLFEQKPATNQVISFTLLGPPNVPASPDGWYQYSFVGAYPRLRTGERPMQQANVVVDVGAKELWRGAAGAGDYTGTNAPGYLGDANVYIDDIVVHRVRNTEEYWNASLFE